MGPGGHRSAGNRAHAAPQTRQCGALVLDTPAELAGQEIEISLTGAGQEARRTHSLVRQRRIGAGTGYAAVYPDLPAGDYTIWRDEVTAATVTIAGGGRVTRCRWPDSPG